MRLTNILDAGTFRKAWVIVLILIGAASLSGAVFETLHGRVWSGVAGLVGGVGLFWVAYATFSMLNPRDMHS